MTFVPNLKVQVTLEEVEDTIRASRASLISLDNIYARLRHQEAPLDLVEVIFDARSDIERGMKALNEVRRCFP